MNETIWRLLIFTIWYTVVGIELESEAYCGSLLNNEERNQEERISGRQSRVGNGWIIAEGFTLYLFIFSCDNITKPKGHNFENSPLKAPRGEFCWTLLKSRCYSTDFAFSFLNSGKGTRILWRDKSNCLLIGILFALLFVVVSVNSFCIIKPAYNQQG